MMDQNILMEEEKEDKRVYKLSIWWLEHRAFFRRLGYGVFILFDAVLLLFVSWTMIDSFIIGYTHEERSLSQMIASGQADLRAYTVSHAADPLISQDVQVFPIGNSRYDFYTQVANPNKDWWVEFDYQFVFDAGHTEVMHGFLLPEQQKPFVSLAVTSQTSTQTGTIVFTNMMWHRIDHKVIPDYQKWQSDRLNFFIDSPTYTKETAFENNEIGRTSFRVTNKTVYAYFDPVFYVLLKRGVSVVGVSRVTIESIGSDEEKEISLNWFGSLPNVSSVEVVPDVNLFDPGIYQRPEGKSSIDARTVPLNP